MASPVKRRQCCCCGGFWMPPSCPAPSTFFVVSARHISRNNTEVSRSQSLQKKAQRGGSFATAAVRKDHRSYRGHSRPCGSCGAVFYETSSYRFALGPRPFF